MEVNTSMLHTIIISAQELYVATPITSMIKVPRIIAGDDKFISCKKPLWQNKMYFQDFRHG